MASSDLPQDAGPDGARVVAMLRKLAELTRDETGAQRVAWTDVWQRAHAFLREQLRWLPVPIGADAAGNQWARLPGGWRRVVIIGSHLDSVSDGGWLVRKPCRLVRTAALKLYGQSSRGLDLAPVRGSELGPAVWCCA